MNVQPDPIAYPPRGLKREEAARYVGVPPEKFDEMVADRRMPRPRKVDRRNVWDRFQLDAAFTELPDGGSWIDKALAEGKKIARLGE